MEPQQQPPVQPVTPLPVSSNVGNKSILNPAVVITIVAVILIGGYFAYAKVYIPKQEAKAYGQKVLALEQRIASVPEGDFVGLSSEEYGMLLRKPVVNPDVNGIVGTTDGITIGLDDGSFGLETTAAFNYVPNIGDSEEVFVRFDSILTKDGTEVFDKGSAFEEDNDIFTDLELSKRSSGDKPYWLGSRDIHTVSGMNDIKVSDIAKASGYILFKLPTGITSIKLTKDDIGKEKPFGGAYVTLKEITNNSVSFDFTGEDSAIYGYTAYDANGKELERNDGSSMSPAYDGSLYTLNYEGAASFEVWTANIQDKEYPFTIAGTTASTKSPAPVSTTDRPTTNTTAITATTTEQADVTSADKEAIITAYFDFGKLLDSGTPESFLQYLKKAYPEQASEIQTEYEKDPNPKDFKSGLSFIKSSLGYETITAATLHSGEAVWTEESGKVQIVINHKNSDGSKETYTFFFTNVAGTWYLDFLN